jgi:hypothetical protein
VTSETAARLTEVAHALGRPYKTIYRIVDMGAPRPGRGGERWLDAPEMLALSAVLKLSDTLSPDKMRNLYACSVRNLRGCWKDAREHRMLVAYVEDRCDFHIVPSREQERRWLEQIAEKGGANVVVDVPEELQHIERCLGRIRRMAPQRRRGRPRISDEEHRRLLEQASGFSAPDDVTTDEINELI